MTMKKFGSDAYGQWERDEHSLPVYVLDPSRMPPLHTPQSHVLGTGRITLLGDPNGRVRLEPAPPAPPSSCGPGTLLLALRMAGKDFSLLPACLPMEMERQVRWGCGHLTYEWTLPDSLAKGVSLACQIRAPRGRPCFHLTLHVENHGAETCAGNLWLATPLGHTAPEGSSFVRKSIAIANARNGEGDTFLGGGAGDWEAEEQNATISLRTRISVAPGETMLCTAVFGRADNCSAQWLFQELDELENAIGGGDWSELLNRHRQRAPELWMQEECLWDVARMLSFAQPSAASEPVITPLGRQNSVRELVALAEPAFAWVPDTAIAQLELVTACQRAHGRLPERLGDTEDAKTVDTRMDRSDLEIALLAAWCGLVEESADYALLDRVIPYADGVSASLWDHLRAACEWIREEIGLGPHGLVRMLAGDSCAHLDRVGIGGVGESTVNTAKLCCALGKMAKFARRRGDAECGDSLEHWHRTLRNALSDTFDNGVFARAFTDQGRAVGMGQSEPAYADAQTWCVLAQSGTPDQRREALDTILKSAGDELPVPFLTHPYPYAMPTDVSSRLLAPGHGWNGGFVLSASAMFIRALATAGRRAEAQREWQKLCVRHRAEWLPDVGAAHLMNAADTRWMQDGTGTGTAADPSTLPDVHAVAWQELTLRHTT
ncbi:MAG: hypothetical protein KAI66_25090 [Lentisphaeria bacterium]|nr:hypothetical protein [Lentisphaeria bacterium]